MKHQPMNFPHFTTKYTCKQKGNQIVAKTYTNYISLFVLSLSFSFTYEQMYTFKLYLWSPSFGREVAKVPVKPTPTTGEPIAQKMMHFRSQVAFIYTCKVINIKFVCVCQCVRIQMKPTNPLSEK